MLRVRPNGEIYVVNTEGGSKRKKQYVSTSGLSFIVHAGKTIYIHKVVAEIHVNNPEGFKHVKHLDGDVSNNHYENLVWTERRKGPKLNPADVEYIKASGHSGVFLARVFKVSPSTICNIRKGRRWS